MTIVHPVLHDAARGHHESDSTWKSPAHPSAASRRDPQPSQVGISATAAAWREATRTTPTTTSTTPTRTDARSSGFFAGYHLNRSGQAHASR